ncbi:MAG: phytoene desaturase family protein [Alphaproteobacteria bacterium]
MPYPSERNYDGIIIGAGHHGLILGSYLARAGLKILLLDRRMMYGGGLNTVEATVPGFYHNLHSINHFHISETPWFKDLGLDARVEYLTPEHEFAQPYLDGKCMVLGRNLDATCASIARFSKKDAQTFRDWNAKAEAITQEIFLPERFAEPLPAAERNALLQRTQAGRDFLAVTQRQPFDLVDELFESDRVKLIFLFKVSLFGTWLVDTLNKTSPMGSVIRAFDLQTGYQLCKGGSYNLARGLMESFIAAGGTFLNQVHVERILIEGGKATGVTTSDGRTFRARQFVASTVDVQQTFEHFVGREQFPEAFRAKVSNYKHTEWTLFGVHLALSEMPQFTAAAFDPNIQHTLKLCIGSETMNDLLTAFEEVKQGKAPTTVQFGGGVLSAVDPTQAPPGKHTAYAWHVMPFKPDVGAQSQADFEAAFAERIVERWAQYAPNVNRKTILGKYVYTARHYAEEIYNMRSGDIFMGTFSADQVMDRHFGYRSPIPNLYMAGSAGHPGGAISGGAGYISAGLIAKDLGVKLWWQPVDARRALERVA